jgi:hypothetical protein
MADFTLINFTAAAVNNVNAGGDDLAAWTVTEGITMTNAELLTFCQLSGVAALQDAPTAAEKAALTALLLDDTSDLDLSTARKREVFGESREELKLVRGVVRAA